MDPYHTDHTVKTLGTFYDWTWTCYHLINNGTACTLPNMRELQSALSAAWYRIAETTMGVSPEHPQLIVSAITRVNCPSCPADADFHQGEHVYHVTWLIDSVPALPIQKSAIELVRDPPHAEEVTAYYGGAKATVIKILRFAPKHTEGI